MPQIFYKFSLKYFVVLSLLLVGMVPLVLTGWSLSERSARELRAVENRYQTQLVQEKARQIEMFGQKYGDLVGDFAQALELNEYSGILSSVQTEQRLSKILKENPNLLALSVKPAAAESLSAFRAEAITRDEVEKLSGDVSANAVQTALIFGQPNILNGSKEPALAIAAPIFIKNVNEGTVTAVVSMREIARSVVGVKTATEEELWKSGLPIVFVVDSQGHAVFHPDANLEASQKSLTDLKIVQEWQESNKQIQSALVPFTADFANEKHEMIGAYSTVNFSPTLSFGVITMQDEKYALASVGEMRRQTWIISLAFAALALIIGFLLSSRLTSPLLKLSAAAQKIAGGDYSQRVEINKLKEIGTLGETFNLMSGKVEEQIANLAKAAQENHELFVGTVKALAAAIDGKDHYTRGHSERVSRISVAVGQRLGLDAGELEKLRISALLHDVGKIAVDDAILKKPAALTNEEFEIMKTHPAKGYKIMSQIPAMKDYLPGILMHHEMVNGAGYPQGLIGEQIPMQAKIISVADTFDAITIDRPYQKGMSLEDSLSRIQSFVGSRYDPEIVRALTEACQEGQIGIGVVKLKTAVSANDNRYQPPGNRKIAENAKRAG